MATDVVVAMGGIHSLGMYFGWFVFSEPIAVCERMNSSNGFVSYSNVAQWILKKGRLEFRRPVYRMPEFEPEYRVAAGAAPVGKLIT
ncbi:hypothetical protein ACFYTQ_15850 [Nocardia sp. NPDC004068]|uniref:hypothetical protein n=1 Tax=Nocardia sp. NPDC004068 TaxID=3364303 RepID=UPI0036A4DC23